MFLEPNPFVENGQGQGYYQKSNSRSPTQSPRNDAHPISKQEPPATPTPSAVDHYHHHANEPPSRRPQFQPVTTLQIPIPRRAEPSSPDMTRPPHPSAVPASVHAQAALRRPAYSVPIVPKPSPPQPSLKKGFHVVKYEVKQERYYLHPSLKGQKISPPAKHHPPPPPSYNTNSMPPSDTTHHNNNHMVPSIESNGSSSGDEDSNSDSNGESDEGEEDDSEPEDANSSSEEEEEVVPKPKPGKRKRAAGMGPIKFKEEAGSSFIDKNAHIKRPRNAWIHFRCHYGQALKAQDPTLRTDEISNMSSRSLSRRASRRWAKLTDKQKKPWHDLAEQEKQAHKEAFPEYRYCPKRNAKKERQKYKRKNQLGTIMK
ncbi:unnamed protein product [Umbelopsis vinacea]